MQLPTSSPEEQSRTFIYVMLTIAVLAILSVIVGRLEASPYRNWGQASASASSTGPVVDTKLVIITHAKCQPCQSIPKHLAALKPLGWNDSHITVIKHFGDWQFPVYPVYIRFSNNMATAVYTGVLEPVQMTTFYYENKLP